MPFVLGAASEGKPLQLMMLKPWCTLLTSLLLQFWSMTYCPTSFNFIGLDPAVHAEDISRFARSCEICKKKWKLCHISEKQWKREAERAPYLSVAQDASERLVYCIKWCDQSRRRRPLCASQQLSQMLYMSVSPLPSWPGWATKVLIWRKVGRSRRPRHRTEG